MAGLGDRALIQGRENGCSGVWPSRQRRLSLGDQTQGQQLGCLDLNTFSRIAENPLYIFAPIISIRAKMAVHIGYPF
jgi:hypothetical protein